MMKKSLGQNFLRTPHFAEELVRALKVSTEDIVVEVGPGKGVITELLLQKAKKVIAVEKDDSLIAFLDNKFASAVKTKTLEVVHGDILLFDPKRYGLRGGDYKLTGSIPYYITGKLFRTFLSEKTQPNTIAFIIQKEVAERIVAKNKKESLLSLGVKAYGTPRYVQTVKAGAFYPVPNVDSAILTVEHVSKKFFVGISEKKFFEILRAGFGSKRKMLASNLKKISKTISGDLLEAAGIPQKSRAEDLTLTQWKTLCQKLTPDT